jgi:hypothetical protein
MEFCENYQFLCEEGSYLLLRSKYFWVAFLLGWVVEAMLHDVVLLGVLAGDWALFSPDTFPCYPVQFSHALQCLCVAIARSRIVVIIVPVFGHVSMDKRVVKANCQ